MSRPACEHGIPTIYECPDCAVRELDDEIVQSAALTHRRDHPPRSGDPDVSLAGLMAFLDAPQ